jgi:uncharacterized protein with HEPN domain
VKEDRHQLQFVLTAIEAIRAYLSDRPNVLFDDRRTQKAVLRELHELSETTQRFSTALKARHPEVPWTSIAAFRNVVVHGYLGIDLHRIQRIIEEDLPPLEAAVKTMLTGPQ